MRILIALGALLACAPAFARPVVIEGKELVTQNSDLYAFAGDDVIITRVEEVDPSDVETEIWNIADAWHRNANGQWAFVKEVFRDRSTWAASREGVAMSATVAALSFPSGLHIFEKTAAGWVEAPLDVSPRPTGYQPRVRANTVLSLTADCGTGALLIDKSANGHWTTTATLPATSGACITSADFDGAQAIVIDGPLNAAPQGIRIFERSGSAWMQTASFPNPETAPNMLFGPALAIHKGLAVVSGTTTGPHVYRRGAAGWTHAGTLVKEDAYDNGGGYDRNLEITDSYVLGSGGNNNRRTEVGYLWRRNADQTIEHVADLVSDGSNGIFWTEISGNRVLASEFGTLWSFDLPATYTQPPVTQDDFENGASSGWVVKAGQFAVATDGATRVYRQSNLAGDFGAVLAGDYTNETVSADIRMNAFNGDDRWVGLVARYVDENNYYYVTLRNGTDQLLLKKRVDGVYSTIANIGAPTGVTPGARYRLTLECSGSLIQVYVDGVLLTRAFDKSLTHGQAGVRGYKAAADFDNFVVTPGPLTLLTSQDQHAIDGTWSLSPEGMSQTSLAGNARAVSGVKTEDQAIQAVFRVEQFAASGASWAGLMVRYTDPGNYYYVTARKEGQLSLRKLTNGAITVLGTVPFTMAPNTAVKLRLEAVGDKVRVFSNDVLLLQSAGAEIRKGQAGGVTYRAAASYSALNAWEP